ncbi:pyruvate, phosphate dikinase [Mesorhizobium sp. M1E.F.Ca.ET.045.02.1.1]|nr:pyruvate, phosphate dikinase [Mesorhizobium sp. M1E.F.Ca.ET.045.02.1.1]
MSASIARIRPEANEAKIVYSIGAKTAAERPITPDILGFKAHNLARMAAFGLNVPPAFVIGTGFCAHRDDVTPEIWGDALTTLEHASDLRLGDSRRPLLLSVRSGAPVSMPGMMETLLNIGLTEATLPGFVRLTGHPRLAWDAYRRLIAGFGEVVAGVDAQHFEADLDAVRNGEERSLDFVALRDVAGRHLQTFAKEAGHPFPQDAKQQLTEAIGAVFRSWSSDKAVTYRNLHGLSHDMGTAVTVQRMVFGNAGGLSGAGVGFTRNPSTGAQSPWVDFLFNAQGEDVVSGRRTAQGHDELAAVAPSLWDELVQVANALERHFGDMQDFEFTIEDGVLFMLQTRNGKRTPRAAAQIALDMLDQGLIDAETARLRTNGLDASSLSLSTISTEDGKSLSPIATAASAATGVASGEIAFEEDVARRRKQAGAQVILVRRDAETRDIAALELADGLLTQHGARTSHAAVVARQLGKVCLVGCETMMIDEAARCLIIGGVSYSEGTILTLDGNSGNIYAGAASVSKNVPEELLARLNQLRNPN